MKTNNRYVAQEYVASSPDAEVIGSLLPALIDNLKADEIRPLLDKYNPRHEEIDVNKWYSQQVLLDIYRAIGEGQVNATENLVATGMKSAELLPFDPGVRTIEQAVAAFDAVKQQTHRNIPEDEGISVVESQPGHVIVVNNTPIPTDHIYGVLWALAKRFRPAGASFVVLRIENPTQDQFPGTAFEIDWANDAWRGSPSHHQTTGQKTSA